MSRIPVVLLAAAVLLAAGWSIDRLGTEQSDPGTPAAEQVHAVTYEVTGTAAAASITFEHPTGSSQVDPVTLPWRTTFEAPSGQFVYLSAQNDTQAGTIVVRIDVDGATIGESQASGAYVIATADGTIKADMQRGL